MSVTGPRDACTAALGWMNCRYQPCAETAAAMFLEYISKQSFSEMVTPRLGGTKTQMEQWKSFMMAAAKMRSDLGISPASYARLAKDLGLAHKANEDALERLATAGAEITSRRLEREGGDAPA